MGSTNNHSRPCSITTPAQVFPPSVEICTVWSAASGSLSVPRMRRPALPSLVRKSSFWKPLSLPMLVTSAVGKCVSTVKSIFSPGALALPAASTATWLKLCAPSASGTFGVNDHSPESLASTRSISTPLS
ncbi:hypothetical protein D3C71_1389260 [compost metagenome]